MSAPIPLLCFGRCFVVTIHACMLQQSFKGQGNAGAKVSAMISLADPGLNGFSTEYCHCWNIVSAKEHANWDVVQDLMIFSYSCKGASTWVCPFPPSKLPLSCVLLMVIIRIPCPLCTNKCTTI